MKRRTIKIFSTAVCFVFWAMSGPLAYAFEINQYLRAVPRSSKILSQNSNTSVPQNPKGVVYFIHDIHAQKEAQLSIGSLIKEISSKIRCGFIGLEGYEGSLSLDAIRAYPHTDVVEAVSDYFLEHRKISGPVHAALTSRTSLPRIYGIEDSHSYRSHVEIYQKTVGFQKSVKEALAQSRKALREKSQATLNQDLKRLQDGIISYREGNTSLEEHLTLLCSLPLKLTDRVRPYQTVLSLEKSFSMAKAQSEKTRFLTALTRRLSKSEQTELLQKTEDLKNARLSNGAFTQHLIRLAQAKGASLGEFKNLEVYFEYAQRLEQIDIQKLPEDISLLEKEGTLALAKNLGERELIEQERFIALSENLANLTLTPADWSEYQNLKEKYESTVPGRLAYFENFYHAAGLRDTTLASNIVRTMQATRSDASIVVAGGFHYQGIQKRLEKEGFAVISVLPSVSVESISSSSPTYLKELSTGRSVLERVLSGSVWTLGLVPSVPEPVLGAAVTAAYVAANPGAVLGKTLPLAVPAARSAEASRPAPLSGKVTLSLRSGTVDAVARITRNNAGKLIIGSLLFTWIIFQNATPTVETALTTVASDYNGFYWALWGIVFAPVVALASRIWHSPRLRRMALVIPLVAMFFLPMGCSTPHQSTVEELAPYKLGQGEYSQLHIPGAVIQGWLDHFKDPLLNKLVMQALERNMGLQQALTDVTIALELAGEASGGFFPKITGGGNANASNSIGLEDSLTVYGWGLGVDLTLPLDFWKTLAKSSQAKFNVLARQHLYQAARQSVAIQVAKAYFQLIGLEKEKAIVENGIAQFEASLNIAQQGNYNHLKVDSIEKRWWDTRARLTQVNRSIKQVEVQLQNLTVQNPAEKIQVATDLPDFFADIPVGLPSELPTRRHDIQAAMAEANAQHEESWEKFWDRFPFLNLALGLTKNQALTSVTSLPVNDAWRALMELSGPIVNIQELASAQGASEQKQRRLVIEVILKTIEARQEVELALNAIDTLDIERAFLERSKGVALRRSEGETSKLVQTNGDPIEVANSLAELIQSDASLTVAHAAAVSARLDLFIALGMESLAIDQGTLIPNPEQGSASPQEGKKEKDEGRAGRSSRTADAVVPNNFGNTNSPAARRERSDSNVTVGNKPVKKPYNGVGGSVFTNLAYVAFKAHRETSVAFLLGFLIHLVSHFYSFGVDPRYLATFSWAAVPFLFQGIHLLGDNRQGVHDPIVVRLMAFKAVISSAAIVLILATETHVFVPWLVLSPAILLLQEFHRKIQMKVVADIIAGNSALAVDYRGLLFEAQAKRIQGRPAIQVGIQKLMATGGSKLPTPNPGDLKRGYLDVITLVASMPPAEQNRVILGELAASSKELRPVKLFLTDGNPAIDALLNKLARKEGVIFASAPSVFDSENGVQSLSLRRLDGYLEMFGHYGPNRPIILKTPVDLALITDGLSSHSLLRQALFMLLTDKAFAPFGYGALENMNAIARVLASQA